MKALTLWSTLVVVVAAASTSRAAGIAPTHISLPNGPGSIEGLGRNFVPSLASGTAAYGVDIAVPPGAGAFSPKLSVDYDSGGGVSELGLGWHLGGVPRIRRRTENGLPRFDATDAFELVGLGLPCDLLEMAPGIFRPEEESGAFVRVQRSADGATWEARDKTGVTYRFGGPGFVESEKGKVASYLLRESIDLHGHKIAFAWDTSEGRALLENVTWNDFGEAARNVVRFIYEDRPDRHVLFSGGIRQTLTRRLKTIEVTHGGALVRRYELAYAPGVHSQLARVELVGSDGTSRLPALSLVYTEPSFAGDGQIMTMTNPPGRSPADPNVEIADLDGDGLPDLLVTQAGQFRSYLNHDGTSWRSPVDWSSASSPSVALGATGVQLADLDGDGALDLVAKSGIDAFRYFPGRDGTSFAPAVAIARVPNFSFEDPDVKLGDFDGDRRIDVAITTAAGLAIAYNLGGNDWTEPALVGVVDPRQPLRFSDGGHTQLCEVNGDRVLDLCYLRPGALTYWLGRGRGRFETAAPGSGVPNWDPSSPWELHDLDGDGWVDLVHVGVDGVDYALATAAGEFSTPRRVAGTPEKGLASVVRFADMNGSGTTDIVWIDVSGSSAQAWRYLELFPEGRAGLLKRVDNGLGKVTTITYAPAALDAAAARVAGTPWTTRMNVAMPVIRRVDIDDSLADPTMTTEYIYRSGAYDRRERTFAGFAGGIEKQIGDTFTPTLVTESTFDTGLVHRMLRGAVLTTEQRDEQGYIFSRSTVGYSPRPLGMSLDGRAIDYVYKSSEKIDSIEGSDLSKVRTTLTEWEQDEFGNVTAERRWGEIVGADNLAGNDEAITLRTYANNARDWVLGRLATEELQDGSGARVSLKRNYYDGDVFTGLPLGMVTRGDLVRQEAWVGPAADAFELDNATAYDSDGNPTETKDARGGGRIFVWDLSDHTRLRSETVKLESGNLTEVVEFDPAFGVLLNVTGYNGQNTSYQYDALGRLTGLVRPGDAGDKPTITYAYEASAPLSRIVTNARLWAGKDELERSETLIDGAGRKRGTLTRGEADRWILAEMSLLDARGQQRRTLRPRFASSAEHDAPPLLSDGPGVDIWRDATLRTLRTRTQLGIETRTSYEPFVAKRWDGAANDPTSPYEHTPTIELRDGLGRTVGVSQTLATKVLSGSYRYDAAGRLVARSDPEANSSSYRYDGRGRRVFVHDPDAGDHTFVFDATGNELEHHKPDGTVVRRTYDLAGRELTQDWDGDGKPEVVETWDRSDRDPPNPLYAGKLAKMTDPSGSTEYGYDARQRLTVSRQTIDGATYEVKTEYDDQDRGALHVYPDGSSLRMYRNPLGQVSGYGRALEIAYDADGVELQKKFNTGVIELTSYDGDRRKQENRVKSAGNTIIQDLKWTYDGAGNIVRLDDLRPSVDAAHDRSETYTYDNLYRLRGVNGSWGNTQWDFSLSGNLTNRTSTIDAQNAGRMTYGSGAGPHALTGIMGRPVTYDSVGRMRSDGDRSYGWNDADQLTKVASLSGGTVESAFDGHGTRRLRVERDVSGDVHRTVFLDAWTDVQDGKLVRFVVHGGRRIARLSDQNGQPSPGSASSGGTLDEPPHERRPFGSIDATSYFLVIALAAALLDRYRRALKRRLLCGVPAVAVLVLLACCADEKTPPLDSGPGEGTVLQLGEQDELLFSDRIGSLTEVTSGSGKPKATFASYPFGFARYDTSTETRKYAGSPRDVGVGLDQMGARSLAVDLGVWTSTDPLLLSDPAHSIGHGFASQNAYVYANLTPVIAMDPTGLAEECIDGVCRSFVAPQDIQSLPAVASTGGVSRVGRADVALSRQAPTGPIGPAQRTSTSAEPNVAPRGFGKVIALLPRSWRPDYLTFTVSAGGCWGATGNLTLDRSGQVHGGLGLNAGKSLTTLSLSLVAGYWTSSAGPSSGPATQLSNSLNGDSVNVSGSAGALISPFTTLLGGGVTSSSGGLGKEVGVFSPQFGVSFTHGFNLRRTGNEW